MNVLFTIIILAPIEKLIWIFVALHDHGLYFRKVSCLILGVSILYSVGFIWTVCHYLAMFKMACNLSNGSVFSYSLLLQEDLLDD